MEVNPCESPSRHGVAAPEAKAGEFGCTIALMLFVIAAVLLMATMILLPLVSAQLLIQSPPN